MNGGTRGYTLFEMMIVLVVMGVMISFGVPQFVVRLEQSRADVAGANLRAIWTAERIYWLDNRTYTTSLSVPASLNLLDPSIRQTRHETDPDRGRRGPPPRRSAQPTSPGQAPSRSRRTAGSPDTDMSRVKPTSWSASSEEWRSMKVARDSFLTSGLRFGRRWSGSSLLRSRSPSLCSGIGLAGLCPFVIMQLKQLVHLELRFMRDRTNSTASGWFPTRNRFGHLRVTNTTRSDIASSRPAPQPPSYYYYIVPWNNPWAQKLTTRAQLLTAPSNTSDPTVTSQPAAGFPHVTQPQAVSLTLDVNGNVTAVTAVVQVN